jgi:hypothetical protein
MPWQNLTGLAKIAAIFATVLVIASGLCGLNLLAATHEHDYPNGLVIITGILELVAMIASAGGLVILGLIAVIKTIFPRHQDKEGHS